MLISNVCLPFLEKSEDLYSLVCEQGIVKSIERLPNRLVTGSQQHDAVVDGEGGLLIPSLCHAHIHLDKCYILGQGGPLVTGDFSEALRVTSAAKARFSQDAEDLYARGKRLIRESVASGVTDMRAHVEVDAMVGAACVEVAFRLHKEFKDVCNIEVAVFMQDPMFDSENSTELGENARVLSDILDAYSPSHPDVITAVGSAPYVEKTREQQLRNIAFLVSLAETHDLHLDFHLDYDLGERNDKFEPLVFPLLEYVALRLPSVKSLTLGHITRLSVFSAPMVEQLRANLLALALAAESNLRQVSFVGLPQSDLYMMGRRPASPSAATVFGAPSTPRGTLDIPRFRRFCDAVNADAARGSQGRTPESSGKNYHDNLNFVTVAMSVNNVGNAFTPQGSSDPLSSLCPLGVAVYQDATREGCRILLESVSNAARLAIGGGKREAECKDALSLVPAPGQPADFVILHDNSDIQNAVLEPCFSRTTIKGGRVVARRVGSVQI